MEMVAFSAWQQFWFCVLPVLSVALAVTPFISVLGRYCYYTIRRRESAERHYRGLLFWTSCVLLATWFLRFGVGLFANAYLQEKFEDFSLVWYEEVFNSLIHALQTLSMDESYTLYIRVGRHMMISLFGEGTAISELYGIYASVLNVLAPVLGGAFLLDILANIFPRFKLWFSYVRFRRETCYFSELNETSLALAKSLLMNKKRPVLVFTDAYADRAEEKENELLGEAKRIGAICLRDDMIHINKKWCGPRSYFLMDLNEHGNLRTLTQLASMSKLSRIRDSKIYLFVTSDAHVRVEKQVRRTLMEHKFFREHEDRLPVIVPVNGVRNLVTNLFADVPLYEPLIGAEDDKTINLTILGGGQIGIEALLAAYWMGQVLDHTLRIHVIAKESKRKFYAKLNYINPEIMRSMCKGDDILWDGYEKAEPYATLTYTSADVKSGKFWDTTSPTAEVLAETNYFVVALGSDADNIEVADHLRIYIGQNRILQHKRINTVIAYAVYDTVLSSMLNQQCRYRTGDLAQEPDRKNGNDRVAVCSEEKSRETCKRCGECVRCKTCARCERCDRHDIYMLAFGDLCQVYSVKNIQMTEHSVLAEETGAAYQNEQRQSIFSQNRERGKENFDSYTYWANMARALHLKYKVYSLGGITKSVFNCPKDSQRRKASEDACADYIYMAITEGKEGFPQEETAFAERFREKRVQMAWLEHRRWNAFLRSCGFRSATIKKSEQAGENAVEETSETLQSESACFLIEEYFRTVGSHKNLSFKLHPYLVECPKDFTKENLLTLASREIYRVKMKMLPACETVDMKVEDVRAYDYYSCEVDTYYTVKEASEKLAMDKEELCAHPLFKTYSIRPDVPELVHRSVFNAILEQRYHSLKAFREELDLTEEELYSVKITLRSECDAKNVLAANGTFYLPDTYYQALRCRILEERQKKQAEE